MKSWDKKCNRSGVLINFEAPEGYRRQLLKNKAMGNGSFRAQIIEALKFKWGFDPTVPVQSPAPDPRVEALAGVDSRYRGMRVQHVIKDSGSGKISIWETSACLHL